MRLHNVLIFFIMILITRTLNAQDFYTYKLFDNQFQAVFPGEPSHIKMPKVNLKTIPDKYKKQLSQQQIKQILSKAYTQTSIYRYIDKMNGIVYTASSTPSSFKYNIGEYRQSIKKDLDEIAMANQSVASNQKIIHFSSTFNRKKNIYIAISTSSFYLYGNQCFKNTKYIHYKNKIYVWSVMHSKYSDKSIFDTYEQYCKIIK